MTVLADMVHIKWVITWSSDLLTLMQATMYDYPNGKVVTLDQILAQTGLKTELIKCRL